MSFPCEGETAKSTEKRPEFSSICFNTTWLTCQLWLFCPVINKVLIGFLADTEHTHNMETNTMNSFPKNKCLMVLIWFKDL